MKKNHKKIIHLKWSKWQVIWHSKQILHEYVHHIIKTAHKKTHTQKNLTSFLDYLKLVTLKLKTKGQKSPLYTVSALLFYLSIKLSSFLLNKF